MNQGEESAIRSAARQAHIALIDIDLNELLTGRIFPIFVVPNVEGAEARTGGRRVSRRPRAKQSSAAGLYV